jgi:uncharacterized protein YjiS (DUF1127 family)
MFTNADCTTLPRHPAALHRLGRLGRAVQSFQEFRQRRNLARLDDHMLADIGISRDEALAESRRPIWDVTPTWRC